MAGQTGLYVARDAGGNGTLPQGARLALGGTLAHTGVSPLDVRKGVLVDGGGPVVSGTGAMAYSVRAFVAVTMATTANGPVVLANDSAVTLPTTAAPGSNSRYDVVWVRPHLLAGDGGSDADVITEIGVTQGAVAASPAVPAIPTGALSLDSALVTANATSTAALTFTRTHDWTTANGGIIPDGLGNGLVFDGINWVPIAFADTGWVTTALTPATNWTIDEQYTRKIGSRVEVQAGVTYTGPTVTPPADGNLGNIKAFTLAAPYRPYQLASLGVTQTGRMAAFGGWDSGDIFLTALASTANLTAGSAWTLQGNWLTA